MSIEQPEWWTSATSGVPIGDDVVSTTMLGPTESNGRSIEPLVIIHGFPTSAYDFAAVARRLARHRTVVIPDLPGYGLSTKSDRSYSMTGQADAVEAVLAHLGIDRFALLTHDMGDTVGGELLARHVAGDWPVDVTRRVVTNGSIYIEMANLTAGQEFLLSLPDELGPERVEAPVELLATSLADTLAEANRSIDMTVHAELICADEGDRLLPRLIRYIEERRANQERFTGAIESHPSPLTIAWGPEDPIAVAAMAERLLTKRPDATLRWIDDSGHYPQIEDPDAWLAAVLPALEP